MGLIQLQGSTIFHQVSNSVIVNHFVITSWPSKNFLQGSIGMISIPFLDAFLYSFCLQVSQDSICLSWRSFWCPKLCSRRELMMFNCHKSLNLLLKSDESFCLSNKGFCIDSFWFSLSTSAERFLSSPNRYMSQPVSLLWGSEFQPG